MFRQIRDSNAPSQPFSKLAELVTGLGVVLHRNDTPRQVSGLWYLLVSHWRGWQRPGQVNGEQNWILEQRSKWELRAEILLPRGL